MTGIFVKRGAVTQRQRHTLGKCHVKTLEETGAMQEKDKGYQGLMATTRD